MKAKQEVFIFGGLGFIGHRIAIKLSERYCVHVVDNVCLDRPIHAEIARRCQTLKLHGVELHHLDVLDISGLKNILSGRVINTVYHLAGASSIKSTYQTSGFDQVVGITNALLNALRCCDIERFIYFSSSMVYGDFSHSIINEQHSKRPVDRYGVYKLAAENLVSGCARESQFISVIIRPTAVYGPYDIEQRVVSKLLTLAQSEQDITVGGDGTQKLDFTFVDDVVKAASAAIACTTSEEFNVSFGHSRSMNELAELILEYYPACAVKNYFESGYPTAKRGALNSEKAIRMLGYEPSFSLERGLAELMLQEKRFQNAPVEVVEKNRQPIPLGKPDMLSFEADSVNNVLQTGWLTSGPSNARFEAQFLEYLNADGMHALSVNSCASALILAIQAHNIQGGVIVPAFTFSATVNAVIRAGAKPQFVDIEKQYLGIDPNQLEKAITSDTQAILVVHLAGVICDIDAILKIADKHNLVVIEDCAQALGAEYDGAKAGTFGVTSCFSFFPTKMITTGEGGMLVTRDHSVWERAKSLANHGYHSSTLDREKQTMPWLREQKDVGFNFRMSSVNAAMGVAQMQRLNDIVTNRRKKALAIVNLLSDIENISVFTWSDRYSVYQALNILVPRDCDRDGFVLRLRAEGVMASVHYPEVLPDTDVFDPYVPESQTFPNACEIADRIVTLPLFGSMTQLQIHRVVAVVNAAAASTASASCRQGNLISSMISG